MKKHLTALVVGLLITIALPAQYTITSHTSPGQNPRGLNTDDEQPGEAGYVNIIAPSASTPAPSWSAVQNIPFNFEFNGNPVTQYKVSSTGVLTFTTSATIVPTANNVSLPSTLIPDNSILVWGLTQAAGNDVVRSKTFGTAPLRQHWIYFASYSTPQSSGSNWTYWGIVLEETTNQIYIVDMRTYLTPVSLTIGIQVNGTTAYQLASSPNTPSLVTNGGNAFTPVDNVYYTFTPPASRSVDILLATVSPTSDATLNSTHAVSGSVLNVGAQTIDSLEINWSEDGGQTIHTDLKTGLNLNSFESFKFTHSLNWQALNHGVKEIIVWISVPIYNDVDLSNDTLSFFKVVKTGNNNYSRNVLLEEFTTAPCQFCPDGAVVVENILAQNPNVIAVGLHACFGTDAMTIPEASEYCAAFSNAAPTATVDRVLFSGETQVGFSRNLWQTRANSRSAINSSVGVDINGNYNSFTRQVDITVTTNYSDYMLPNLALTLFVVEDSVVGSGSGYNQVNYYNNQVGHPYYNKGNPIVGYVHKHVLRDVYPANDAWGDNTLFNAAINPNDQITKTYTFTLNNNWDADQVSLVAFVSGYDINDVTNREVLNAKEVKLNNLVVGIDEEKEVLSDLNIYPNPFKVQTNINFSLKTADNVSIDLMDVTGKLVQSKNLGKLNAGNHIHIVNADQLESGFYFIRITVGEQSTTRKVSVMK